MASRRLLLLAATLLLVAAMTAAVLAVGPLAMERDVLAGGGQRAAAGGLVLNGTLGEPVAGSAVPETSLRLQSGFWSGAGAQPPIFLPVIRR